MGTVTQIINPGSLDGSAKDWLRTRGKILRPRISEDLGRKLEACFLILDADNSGELDDKEVMAAMKMLSIPFRRQDVKEMILLLNPSGFLNLENFKIMMVMQLQRTKTDENEEEKPQEQQVDLHSFSQTLQRRDLLTKVMRGDEAVLHRLIQIDDDPIALVKFLAKSTTPEPTVAPAPSTSPRKGPRLRGGFPSHRGTSRRTQQIRNQMEKLLRMSPGQSFRDESVNIMSNCASSVAPLQDLPHSSFDPSHQAPQLHSRGQGVKTPESTSFQLEDSPFCHTNVGTSHTGIRFPRFRSNTPSTMNRRRLSHTPNTSTQKSSGVPSNFDEMKQKRSHPIRNVVIDNRSSQDNHFSQLKSQTERERREGKNLGVGLKVLPYNSSPTKSRVRSSREEGSFSDRGLPSLYSRRNFLYKPSLLPSSELVLPDFNKQLKKDFRGLVPGL